MTVTCLRGAVLPVLAAALAATLVACSGADVAPSGEPSQPGTPSPTRESQQVEASYREITFDAPDGETRSARLFGDGAVAVVLSHMGRSQDSQDDWTTYAGELAEGGYRALTYGNRDIGQEDSWKDVLGAVEYLTAHGVKQVIVAGASLGAMASLKAANQATDGVAGVIWLAGVNGQSGYEFREADVAGLRCPTLFASAEGDAYGGARSARQLHGWATAESELLIVPGLEHGTDILAEGGQSADRVREAMTSFVGRAARSNARC